MNKSAYTTREVAQLANSQVTDIYNDTRMHGKWRDIAPIKGSNGRLSWSRTAVDLALGLTMPPERLSQEQRAVLNWLAEEDVSCTAEVHSAVLALVPKIDFANDPTYVVNRSYAIAAIASAHNRFVEAIWSQLTPTEQSRILTSHSLMTSMDLPTESHLQGENDAAR